MSWLIETSVPILALCSLAVVVPWLAQSLVPQTLPALASILLASALFLVLAGAGIFGWLYAGAGLSTTVLADHPLQASLYFIRLGILPALAWLPILILTGIALGQRIEAARGADAATRKNGD